MKKDIVQFVICLFALVFGGAAEELLPKIAGVGAPLLLSATVVFATRRHPFAAVLFAVAAGAAEDALSALPVATGISFFAATAAFVCAFRIPVWCMAPVNCGFQIWLWIWLGSSAAGNIFMRTLVALPIGVATLAFAELTIWWLDRKGAVGEK